MSNLILGWCFSFCCTVSASYLTRDDHTLAIREIVDDVDFYKGQIVYRHGHDGRETYENSDEWILHLPDITDDDVKDFAESHNFKLLGKVHGFPDHYSFLSNNEDMERAYGGYQSRKRSLLDEGKVQSVQQLFRKKREKRQSNQLNGIFQDAYNSFLSLLNLQSKEQRELTFQVRSEGDVFNDDMWRAQWYMGPMNTFEPDHRDYSINLNLLNVYARGFNGNGVRVTVLDDGLEKDHKDLKDNYDPDISWDYNSGFDGDPDPSPNKLFLRLNAHGTKCAGEIAMTANNGKCGVGVAHKAKIGGIRMLDSPTINDRIEGLSLMHASDKVDIYSASWGPTDDGLKVEGPGPLAQMALIKGILEGRQGKGAIYVWASGNGGANGDTCSCDGYVSSIYTIAIGSTTQSGKLPWYAEKCSSTMAVTPSSGNFLEKKIVTTFVNGECTTDHSGTSASAPLAAGVIALLLEANPDLTWRDVQHLLVYTCEPEKLEHNEGWRTNGVGLKYHLGFGFGLINAENLVNMGEKIGKNVVGPQLVQTVKPTEEKRSLNGIHIGNESHKITFETHDSGISYVEHVEVIVNIEYERRGCIEADLISPSGTISKVLLSRSKDLSTSGFQNWKLMSVAFWGEDAYGKWQLRVYDNYCQYQPFKARFGKTVLIVYGTKEKPLIMDILAVDNK